MRFDKEFLRQDVYEVMNEVNSATENEELKNKGDFNLYNLQLLYNL